uniref:Tc1-like transposase DDE domain-containing protein n=1 Tax=Oryzias latipes TaxID=8090 RepID=H2MQU8_ORYLA
MVGRTPQWKGGGGGSSKIAQGSMNTERSHFGKTKVLSPCHMMHPILDYSLTCEQLLINQLVGVSKKNPSTPGLHINCNLTSDNMPKIHPETKALIIKRLKTRSTAEVADTFNVSQRQVQRIRKRFEETRDVVDKPRSGRPHKTTAQEDRLLVGKSKASPFSPAAELHQAWSPQAPVSTRTVCRVLSENGLHGPSSAQKPALNKRQLKKTCGICQGPEPAKRMDAGKVADGGDESSVELHHRKPTGARMDSRFTQKTFKFGGRKIMVRGYILYGGVRNICRVEGNINSLKYQEVLATSSIPNHKRGQILQQDGAPSHTSISTSKFLKAKKMKVLQDRPAQSPDMNIIEHVWGRMKEGAWKTKPKNLDELWEAWKTAFFAIPDDFIHKLYESLSNRMDAVLQAPGSHTRY